MVGLANAELWFRPGVRVEVDYVEQELKEELNGSRTIALTVAIRVDA